MAIFTLTAGPDTFVGAPGDDTVNGSAATLNASDSLDGGAGHNALALFGAGSFDISALTQFANFQEIDLTNITGGQSNLTLRNGIDLTVNVDNESDSGGVIHLASGAVTLNVNNYGYTVYGSTGTATINTRGTFGSVNLSSGDETINNTGYGNIVFTSSGKATIDFTNTTGYGVAVLDAATINYNDVITGSSSQENELDVEGSGKELDLTRLAITNKWYLLIGDWGSTNVTVDVDANSLSHLYSIDGQNNNNEKLQTAATTLDLTHTPVSGSITIASTNAAGTIFTVADAPTGLHVVGGAGNDTLVGQGFAFTAGQRAAIFAQGSIETITDTSGTYSIPPANGPPFFIGVATSALFSEDDAPVTLTPNLSVRVPNNLNLTSATVAITGGKFIGDGDVLATTTTGTNIVTSYDTTTETLTLSGSDTLAHYSQVLEAVIFTAGENPTNYGANTSRTVTWTVNDGQPSNNTATVTSTVNVTAVNDPPVLSTLTDAGFTGNGAPVTLAPNLTVSDPDDLKLLGATVQITDGSFAGDDDVLSALATNTSITASYDSSTETLALTGSDTLAHYQQVLESVTFASFSPNPTHYGANPTRTVTWVLNDGSASNNLSVPATTTVNITATPPVDSPPVVTYRIFRPRTAKPLRLQAFSRRPITTAMRSLSTISGTWAVVAGISSWATSCSVPARRILSRRPSSPRPRISPARVQTRSGSV